MLGSVASKMLRRPILGAVGVQQRSPVPEGDSGVLVRGKQAVTIALYGAMLVAILALWNNEAPRFIYVAF